MTPETIDLIQKGGMLVLLLFGIGWMGIDRNRLLESLKSKDALIAKKDDQLISLTERTITVMTELKGLMGGRGV